MPTLDSLLRETATRVFEDLCFFSMNDSPPSQHGNSVTVTIPFSGPASGNLLVRLTGVAIDELACNMLGEERATPAQESDALGELGNVLCGHVLPVVWGEASAFEIQKPVVLPGAGPASDVRYARVSFETGQVELALWLERGSLPPGLT